MLTHDQLLSLARAIDGERVLSVYLDGELHDPAERFAWRRRLANRLDEIRRSLENAPRGEREAFDGAAFRLGECIAPMGGAIAAPGWVAFTTADGVAHGDHVPVRVPTMVSWGDGPRIAPYLAALKQMLPVMVVVIDSRAARVFETRPGVCREIETMRTQPHLGDHAHRASVPAQGFHRATRGVVGTDRMQEERRAAHLRLVRELRAKVLTLAGSEASVLVGGTPEAAHELVRSLSDVLPGRVLAYPTLEVHAREGEIRTAAVAGAAAMRRSRDRFLASEIVARFAADDQAVLGIARTMRALEERSVEVLCISERLIDGDVHTAESAVRSALEQRARIEVIRDLDEDSFERAGEGLGARLRFSPYRPAVPTGTEPASRRLSRV